MNNLEIEINNKETIPKCEESKNSNDLPYFSHKGYCPCCEEEVVFESKNSWFRDNLLCSNCRSIPRERALFVVIEKYYPNWRKLHIHESSPCSNRGVSQKLLNNVVSYETTHFYPDQPLGDFVGKYQNQNLENQTFCDELFDLVITQDVMEHIYEPEKAFSEIARTLKPGGAHIFTVPLINKHKETEIWATKGEDGKPIFRKTPEWHGNPIDSSGSAVTMHWGFDIVDFIKESSGMETIIETVDNIDLGIRAEYIEVLISKKSETKKQDRVNKSQEEIQKSLTKAEMLIEEAGYEEASKVLNELLLANHNNLDALNDLAVIKILQNNHQEAIRIIKRIFSIDSENQIALGNYEYLIENSIDKGLIEIPAIETNISKDSFNYRKYAKNEK